jgi:3-phenylpropionate/trans-cinnamate dioxygenase ferredoxin component
MACAPQASVRRDAGSPTQVSRRSRALSTETPTEDCLPHQRRHHAGAIVTDWIDACATDDVEAEEVIRFDHGGKTYAIFRSPDDEYCTDGLCTHEKVHLADGLAMDHTIECPKHNGRFDYRTGEATRTPACVNLKPIRSRSGMAAC